MGNLSPAAILYDANGNPISSVLDGSVRRIAVTAALKEGTTVNIGNPSPEDLTTVIRSRLLNVSSADMRVDGSTVPVEFSFSADPTNDIKLYEVRFVMVANTVKIDGGSFGPIAELTNGLKLEVKSNGTVTELVLAKLSEEFLALPNPFIFLDRSGAKDAFAFSYSFGGAVTLFSGTDDFVKVTIQDDLTSAQLQFFEATLSAIEVI